MAEKKTIELEIKSNLADAEKSLGSLKSQLRNAQAEVASLSDKFGATSKEAVAAAKNAAILADKIGDAKALTDAFNPDAKFKAVSSSLAGVASGFAAYQGALGLVGVESKDLEKQLLKVQSAMAIAEGLQGLGEAQDSFKQLKAVGVNAFNAIKGAIGATGIGLIVIAAGAIYAYWDDIKEIVSGVSEEQKKLNNLSKINADLASSKLKDLNNQDNVLKLQGKSEKEILNIKIKATDEAILSAKIQVENQKIVNKLAIEAAERNAKIMQSILKGSLEFAALGLRLLAAPIDLVLSTANKVSETLGFGKITTIDLNAEISKLITTGSKLGTNLLFDPAKVKADGNATIKEAKESIAKMVNDRAGMQLSINAIDKTGADESKKIKEDSITKAKEEADALKAFNDDVLKNQQQMNVDKVNKDIQDKLDEKTSQEERLQGISDQVDAIDILNQKEVDNAKAKKDKQLQDEKDLEAEKLKVKLKALDDLQAIFGTETAMGKAVLLAKQALAIQEMVMSIKSTLFHAKDTATKATITAAGAGVDIATGAAKTVGAAPFPANIPLIIGYAATAIGIAMSIKSALTKVKGAGSGGSAPSMGGGAAVAPAAPSFNVVGASPTNQLAQTIGNQQQQPIKAYVVSNDVTTAQSLDRNIISSASIG